MQKLHTLDAMRGVAAFIVAAFHFGLLRSVWHSPYLAVDFFFALSGFVIAYSYDRKLSAGMGVEEFMRRRLIRLYPLFAFGLVLGLVVTLTAQAHGVGNNDGPAFVQLLTSLVFLPYPDGAPGNLTEASVSPLNGPYWSLILEIHMNLLFALFFRWLGMGLLSILVALLGFAIIGTAWSHGTLETGYLMSTFHFGFVRVGFSFLLGVLICRLRHRFVLPKLHWSVVLALMTGLLILPTPESVRWIYDSLCVLLLFPALILAGAQAQPRKEKTIAAFGLIGGASYALYAIHMPMTVVNEMIAETFEQVPYRAWSVVFLALTVAASFAAYQWLDIPVRRWLQRFQQNKRAPIAGASGAEA